jgi:putative PIN family toxin of toxin-antitoxin system
LVTGLEPRVFLDANVIFSGLYSSQGAPGIILRYFIEGRIRVVISQQVLEEVVRTIKEKLPEVLPALKKYLVNTGLEVEEDPQLAAVRNWADVIHMADAAVLAAAIAAQPDFFVTGDRHFLGNLVIREKSGLKIMSPSQFLSQVARIDKKLK